MSASGFTPDPRLLQPPDPLPEPTPEEVAAVEAMLGPEITIEARYATAADFEEIALELIKEMGE